MNTRKISVVILGASALLGVTSTTLAAETPKIQTVSETKNSVTLPIEYKSLKNKKVIVEVKYTSGKDSKEVTKKFTKKLNSSGDASVTIKKLDPDTKYSFRVEIKQSKSTSAFSNWSKAKEVTTTK